MKNQKSIICVVMMLVSMSAIAQDTASELNVWVENKTYVFEARSMSPLRGSVRQLTSLYTLKIKGDTLQCDLPYLGQVYQASYGGDAGLKFDSYQSEYNAVVRKKGGWDIKIKTKDLPGQRTFYLTIFSNGNASLSVNSTDRQAISYSGVIKKQN